MSPCGEGNVFFSRSSRKRYAVSPSGVGNVWSCCLMDLASPGRVLCLVVFFKNMIYMFYILAFLDFLEKDIWWVPVAWEMFGIAA